MRPYRSAMSCRRLRISTNAMWMPLALSSSSRSSSIAAAVTSMSVIASHCSTTHRQPGRVDSSRTWRRKAPALAKKRGASHR